MVEESPVKAGEFCEHGLSTSFPCSKCRGPKTIPATTNKTIILVVVLAIFTLGIVELIARGLGP
jgi:hypothetical protein